jgi:hypothetical protein
VAKAPAVEAGPVPADKACARRRDRELAATAGALPGGAGDQGDDRLWRASIIVGGDITLAASGIAMPR